MSHRARDIKERMNKWDYIKLKSFCMAKENISKMKREPTMWEIFLPKILLLKEGPSPGVCHCGFFASCQV